MISGEADVVLADKNGKAKKIQRYRDIVMKWKQEINLAVYACENQQNIHYAMPVRIMLYDSLSYTEQMEHMERFHSNLQLLFLQVAKLWNKILPESKEKEGKIDMCKALQDLYGEGVDSGRINTFYELLSSGAISMDLVAEKLKQTKQEVLDGMAKAGFAKRIFAIRFRYLLINAVALRSNIYQDNLHKRVIYYSKMVQSEIS